MVRTCLFLLLAAYLAVSGCSRSRPTVPEQAGEASASTPAAARSESPTNPLPIATTAPPAPAAQQAREAPLREAVMRYLVSDGQGGWRLDEKAATELEKLSPDASQVVPLLSDPDAAVRRGAAYWLVSLFNPSSPDHVAAVTSLLHDNDRTVRGIGLSLAKQLRQEDLIAELPQLTAMLDPQREPDANHRAAAARLAGSLKREAAAAVAALSQAAARDPDAKVRSACLAAIVQVAAPDESVRLLSKGLIDKDAAVRLVAAARLRQLGPAAAPAVNDLTNALGDSDDSVAEAAAEALIRIGSPAVEPLTGQLSSSSTPARKLALACLAKLGPLAKAAMPAVEKCRKDSDPQVRQLAEAAITRLAGK